MTSGTRISVIQSRIIRICDKIVSSHQIEFARNEFRIKRRRSVCQKSFALPNETLYYQTFIILFDSFLQLYFKEF